MGKMIKPFAIALLVLATVTAAIAQNEPEVYSAMLIASEAVAGSGAGRVNIRIVTYTTDAERKSLTEAFQKSQDEGLALLRGMNKGFINIEGQPGRKIFAVFSRNVKDGHEVIIVSEHVASKLEKWRGDKAEEHPLAVIHLRFNNNGDPVSGEVFPAVKLAVTPDGYVDAQTNDSNKVIMTELRRK